MIRIISAVYGDKAAEILKDYIEGLTDDQKFTIVNEITDVLCSIPRGETVIPFETMDEFLKSIYERTCEIIPSYKEKLEEEFKEVLCPPVSKQEITEVIG